MRKNNFTVVLTQDEDNPKIVNAAVPALPGCVSWGYGKKEAMEHIAEAVECYIEEMDESGDPIPKELAVEQLEVA